MRAPQSLCLALVVLCLPSQASGGNEFQAATFDLSAAQARHTLAAEVLSDGVLSPAGVRLREVRFASTAWDLQGEQHSIRIAAFVAVPQRGIPQPPLPVVISAHGLGGQADAQDTVELARNLNVVAISISAPGNGASEGVGPSAEDPRPIFAFGNNPPRAEPSRLQRRPIQEPDIRVGWLYQYIYALLRAVTYATTLAEVDPRGVIVTGVSMGGLATFAVGGLDTRVRGIMPVSAAGGLAAAAAGQTWLRRLVQAAGGLQPSDIGPRAMFRSLDPLAFATRQHGAVYMLMGAQDEYFPLDQVLRTYRALRAPAKSLELVADYDHGWYFGSGCKAECMPDATPTQIHVPRAEPCPASCPQRCPTGARPPYCGPQGSYNRHSDFMARRSLLLRALVSQYAAHPPRAFVAAPLTPFVQRVANQVVVRVPMHVPPRVVRLAISENAGYTFGQYVLPREADGAWHYRRRVGARAILIAEAETADGATATSIPILPSGFLPQLRPFGH